MFNVSQRFEVFYFTENFRSFTVSFFATLVHFSHNFVTKAEKLICMTNFWYVHQWGFKLTLSCVADNSNIFWYLSATNTISLCCQNSSIELIGPLMEVIDQKIGPFLNGQLFKNVKIYVWIISNAFATFQLQSLFRNEVKSSIFI